MKPRGHDRKQAKGNQLKYHTTHGDILAQVELLLKVLVRGIRRREHNRAHDLQEESDDVEADKDGRTPAGGDPEEPESAVRSWHDVEDDTAKDDVDDSRHEYGSQDDEAELRYVDASERLVAG